jgi:predicted nucleic acid-binding protein
MTDAPPKKLRVMVDSNVLFAGSISPRFPYEVLEHAKKGDYYLVLPEYVLYETRRTVKKMGAAALERLEEFLSKVSFQEAHNPNAEEVKQNADLVRDAKDIPIALAAINAQVDFLITQDKDLTSPDAPIHQHLKILLPGTFLREYMAWTSERLEAIRHRTWADLDKPNPPSH